MNKAEAIKVLFEINDKCKSNLLKCVSIDKPSSQIVETPNGYQIMMKCEIGTYAKKCMATVLDKHKLGIKEENGFVILFTQ
jgi:hypothetical protein